MIRGIVSLTIIVVALAWTWKSLTVRPWFLTTDWAADYKAWEARRLRPDQVGLGIVLAETDDPCYNWRQNVVEYYPAGSHGRFHPYIFAVLPQGWHETMTYAQVTEFLQNHENYLARHKGRAPRTILHCTHPHNFHEDCLTQVHFWH